MILPIKHNGALASLRNYNISLLESKSQVAYHSLTLFPPSQLLPPFLYLFGLYTAQLAILLDL
jgi:hypothetical protein